MINVLKIAYCASLLFLAACNNAENKNTGKKETDTTRSKAPVAVHKNVESTKINDDLLNAVYQQYAKLTNALTDGDMAKAKLASNALEAGARQVSGGGSLAASASKIITASSIEMQRAHFSTLSNEMAALIKSYGMKTGEIYLDYCPMALNNQGAYWLSSNKEIRNPYFGEAMRTCGEVKETVK